MSPKRLLVRASKTLFWLLSLPSLSFQTTYVLCENRKRDRCSSRVERVERRFPSRPVAIALSGLFFFLLRIIISELVCGRGNWMLPVQLAAFKISRDLTELMPRRRTLSNESYALHSFFPNNDGDLNNRTVRFTSSSNSFLLSTAPPFLLLLSPETHFKPVIQSNSKWLLKENSSLEERKRCPG